MKTAVAAILILAACCGAARAVDLAIDYTNRQQTMDGAGACSYCFPYNGGGGWDWPAVTGIFDELDLHYIRTAPWLSWWETSNDNANAHLINWDGFQTVNRFADWDEVPLGQLFTARGYEVQLGVWSPATWLANGTPRQIAPASYAELGELIASYVLYNRSNGVAMAGYEIQNEPAIEASVQYPSPHALVTAALAVVEMMDYYGLSNLTLHGPNHHRPQGAADWAAVWFANTQLCARTTALSYHTWWDDTYAYYTSIWGIARQYDKPVWATEVGGHYWNGSANIFSDGTWTSAWKYALKYHKAIAWSHASRVYHWTLLGHDAMLAPNGLRYPSFHVFKHFANFMPPGARLIESALATASMYALVFALPSNDYTAIVLNDRASAMTVTITTNSGPPLYCPEWFTTRENVYFVSNAPAWPDGSLTLSFAVPAKSISSLRLKVIPEPAAATLLALVLVKRRLCRPMRGVGTAARRARADSV